MKEKRKYERYDTEVKIYFQVNYDIKTKVKFQVISKNRVSSKKYLAYTKNVSVEGLCFRSEKKLRKSDMLNLEIYLPRQKKPIYMTGEVRWSKVTKPYLKAKNKIDTGVELLTVYGQPVVETIYFDEKNNIIWSIVLESIFGNFRKLMKKTHNFRMRRTHNAL